MDTLPCGHVAHSGASRMCRHLVEAAADGVAHVRLLTGHGLAYDLCCTACDEASTAGQPVDLVVACEGCVARYTEEDWGWFTAWRGTPGIAERPEPLDATMLRTPLPADLGPVLDLAPLGTGWLLLTADGRLVPVDAEPGVAPVSGSRPAEPDEPSARRPPQPRLHVSPDGRYAAVVTDFGRYGEVVDLDRGAVTFALHGGDYHPDTVPFSFAFATHEGRTVVIHRTAWNRLDVSDAATGRLLSAREPTTYERGQARPEHYLDYFHGALHASPDGHWLADDGWVWHPTGIPRVWDLRRWLAANPWEAEDGPSVRHLCWRDYHWNVPMCWIGNDLLAVGGIGIDDEAMLDGARVFDVATGVELAAFPGPRGAFFGAGQRLYSAGPDGLDVWDPFTGERTGTVPGFVPTCHHTTRGELAAISDASLLRWRLRPPDPALA